MKVLGGILFYGLLLLEFALLVVVPALHAGKRGRWLWLIPIVLIMHLGGAVYWLKVLYDHARGYRPGTVV